MRKSFGLFIAAMALLAVRAVADTATPLGALARLPIREITVFKDGHAFVLHEGKMPVDESGNVQMDYLPVPVLGAFWPYSADPRVKLSAVTAHRRRVRVERTALTSMDMLISNVGMNVVIETTDKQSYSGKILGVPTRSSEEINAVNPPNSDEALPQKSNLLMLKTDNGTVVLPVESIARVTFKGDIKPKSSEEEFRNLLTMKLNWPGAPPKTADVGMVYLQKGVRWIPGYKVTLDGKGSATVQLQATFINELADMKDVSANLVIGVPTFAFKDQVDPMALQQTVAQLSDAFRTETRQGYAFSNAIMSQMGGMGGGMPGPPGEVQQSNPEVAGGGKNEDLYVFRVEHVTLRKGERMVMPIASYTLKYKDLYTLDIPFSPPAEVRARFNNGQDSQIAALMSAPKFMHKIRLINSAKDPLTTAPALILENDRLIAQGMMTYASPGSNCDLDLTTAIDLKVKKTDREVDRTPNAITWQGDTYGRVNCAGTITIANYLPHAANIEVTRYVLGTADKADNAGKVEMVNVFEDNQFVPGSSLMPSWWGWYNWPGWWYHFNGVGRISWQMPLETGKSVSLGYSWHYFWR